MTNDLHVDEARHSKHLRMTGAGPHEGLPASGIIVPANRASGIPADVDLVSLDRASVLRWLAGRTVDFLTRTILVLLGHELDEAIAPTSPTAGVAKGEAAPSPPAAATVSTSLDPGPSAHATPLVEPPPAVPPTEPPPTPATHGT
jgi:hypothetical protein